MAVYYIDGRHTANWHIYAIVCESGDKDFVVKIGVSSTPYERYNSMLTAIPYKSVMLCALVGLKWKAYKLESALHKAFKDRNTTREWFRFSLEDKSEFHRVTKEKYLRRVGDPLEWMTITPASVIEYMKLKAERRDPLARRKREYAQFRMGSK